jgi:hypothetical protein
MTYKNGRKHNFKKINCYDLQIMPNFAECDLQLPPRYSLPNETAKTPKAEW